MQNKKPRNDKGQPHGYWEIYWGEKLYYKGNYINGNPMGYYYFGCSEKRYYAR